MGKAFHGVTNFFTRGVRVKKNLLQFGNVKIDLLQFPILLQDLLQLFYYIISLLSYYHLYFVTNVTNVTSFQSKFFLSFSRTDTN